MPARGEACICEDEPVKVRIAVAPGRGMLSAEFVDGLEARRFDTIWLSDVPMATEIDPIAGLAWAAARTRRLKLGANVVPIGRNPYLLAKALAQLDQLSGGRVLLSIVPGLDQPGERNVLGARNRTAAIEALLPGLRGWWAGEEVVGVRLPALPVQRPLELWLGGRGPKALDRAGRLGDGWLGAGLGPAAAGAARRRIMEAAAAAARAIDPEHYGMSIPYVRAGTPDPAQVAAMRQRYPDADVAELLPIGRAALRALLRRYVDEGITKFVLRPAPGGDADCDEELDWLADAVLDLQT
jgi:probable F420-dependent oxidoreductase